MAMFKEKKLMDAEKKWREADFTNRFMFAKIVKDHPDAARDIANLFTEGVKFGDFVYHNAEQILNFSETMKNTVLDFYGVDPVRNVLVQEIPFGHRWRTIPGSTLVSGYDAIRQTPYTEC